ncbi:MAG: MBL fold metallo-hydrolase [Alphaproteobacteria bacterium]|nr:MBL fold metallo-hydrolase [Alphaproteobacteria bacterium]
MTRAPEVHGFHDPATGAVAYVVADPRAGVCAVFDPVLDYDPRSGRTATDSADRLAAFARERGWRVEWLIDTHVHADHLSALGHLASTLGGRTAIGRRVDVVQRTFAEIYGLRGFPADGSQFDHLFEDGEVWRLGGIEARSLHTPGHTPACMTHVVGDAAFVGDTLFMPGYGTARCDFPGGGARILWRSIRRILDLPGETRLFVAHDYPAEGRQAEFETTVAAQREGNVHVRDGLDEEDFVAMRERRDETLELPALMLAALQVNIRGGRLPEPEADGHRYLRIPLNRL